MAEKIKLYDEKGEEVFFDFPVDAREAVATGRYFESESDVKKSKDEEKPKEEKPKEEKASPGRKPKPLDEGNIPEEVVEEEK